MYSPKIKPDLIYELYWLRIRMNKPMTKLVNEAVQEFINKHKQIQEVKSDARS